jgi:hypothetical protein
MFAPWALLGDYAPARVQLAVDQDCCAAEEMRRQMRESGSATSTEHGQGVGESVRQPMIVVDPPLIVWPN